jgi:hypothetical protein
MPDSIRAELGALFASAVRLKTTLDHQIIQKPDAVHILTDCKAVRARVCAWVLSPL